MNKVVLTLAMLLSGCTTTFTHTTQAPAEFDRELYGCQLDTAPIQDRARSIDMIERCMMIKGWRKAGYAWGFDRFAPVTAQSNAADFKTPSAVDAALGKPGPADAFATGRGATGATSSSGTAPVPARPR